MVSLAVLGSLWALQWPAARGPALLVHASAGLCLAWSLLGLVLNLKQCGAMADVPSLHSSVPGDWEAAARIAALSLGLLAFILMAFHAVMETLLRMLYVPFTLDIWASGMVDLGLLGGALVLARVPTGDRRLITALFWLAIFAGLWMALRVPPYRAMVTRGILTPPVATNWSALFMVWSAAAIGAFALADSWLEHRWRVSAWPAELWKLTSPLPAWPGFRYSAGVMAVVVLGLGCVHVARFWTPAPAFVAGAAMLALVKRKWNENLADVGLALITLGVVSLLTVWRPEPRSDSEYFTEIFNRVIIGLAIMIAFWHWLANVWVQQLDDGRAWTTSGRLIHTARRVGFLLTATAVLVGITLATWPLLEHAGPDNSSWRWAWGLTGYALLIMALAFSALITGKQTLAWMSLLAAVSGWIFLLSRIRGQAFGLWWAMHWPLALAGLAAAALLLAETIRRTRRWIPFWEPLYLSGVLGLPVLAIMGVSFVEQLHLPRWVPAATFGSLAGVYLLAACLPGRRGYAVAAVICAGVSIYMSVS